MLITLKTSSLFMSQFRLGFSQATPSNTLDRSNDGTTERPRIQLSQNNRDGKLQTRRGKTTDTELKRHNNRTKLQEVYAHRRINTRILLTKMVSKSRHNISVNNSCLQLEFKPQLKSAIQKELRTREIPTLHHQSKPNATQFPTPGTNQPLFHTLVIIAEPEQQAVQSSKPKLWISTSSGSCNPIS